MRAYIWTLPTRLFHWMLASYIVFSFFSSEIENLLKIHVAFGYGVGILLFFRFIWGFIGPKYSRFSDWPLGLNDLVEFIKATVHSKNTFAGHNPAASFVMAAILITAFLSVTSGILAYGVQEGRGIFAFLNNSFFKEMDLFEEIHEFFVNILFILISMHLVGLFVDWVLHKETGTVSSMINGYKNIRAEDSKLNAFQKLFAAVFLTFSLIFPIYIFWSDSIFTKSRFSVIDFEKENSLFVEECASCHTLYPPFLLPSNSWKKVMAGLEDHFGDDASLDREDKEKIESFLVENSADVSTKEAAFYIKESLTGKKDIISITETSYWKEKHKNIPERIFRSKSVKKSSNCKACHKNIERGFIEDHNIEIPKA
ncbi:cytochrome b/b6 domain-containing protein [Nitrosophilus alvini]|uniref:cytochrome b/b6 domain-containing protein n=1 Tax=Nitrosophilus alvini TaxID=2714855 RepID=UPI00190D340E|nr:cytochrome b/b6 domain-containing protein [Nitrosophilus alvini]